MKTFWSLWMLNPKILASNRRQNLERSSLFEFIKGIDQEWLYIIRLEISLMLFLFDVLGHYTQWLSCIFRRSCLLIGVRTADASLTWVETYFFSCNHTFCVLIFSDGAGELSSRLYLLAFLSYLFKFWLLDRFKPFSLLCFLCSSLRNILRSYFLLDNRFFK